MSSMPPAIKKLKIDKKVAALLNRALKLEGFFPEFTPEQAEKIFLRSSLNLYPKGVHIVEQSATGRDIYIVQSGKLGVFRKEDKTECVAHLKGGDIFGEIGLLRDGVRTATVTAEEDSRVFHLVHADIEYLLEHNKSLGEHLDHLANERQTLA